MATASKVKPTHQAVKSYYTALAMYADQSIEHEGALRSALQNLLSATARKVGWTLIPELPLDANGHQIRPDGTFRDEFTIERGYWEAKDTDDDLQAEIKKKIKRGYRLTNTIFEDTREARLYQDGKLEMIANLRDPQQLCDLLNVFFSHTEPAHEDFNKAVEEFKQRVPDLSRGLVDLISNAHKNNKRFIAAFEHFFELCKSSLNPNLSTAAVDEMLVQHLLTERLIRTVFDSQDFTRRNVIAAEIEKVIDALVSRSFNRHEYLKRLDRFYVAIEQAARSLSGFTEKQHFLNIVYERFFQGYSVKVADTHGIVYTPQEIVDFMCASVAEVLEKEFGKKLGDPAVNILDPCTGTGNFIVNLIRRIPKRDLPRVYREQLFANEVMLLPYYIAALNIEHAYYERTGQYEPFEGLCFVDTLDLQGEKQHGFEFLTEANTERVNRQKSSPIKVVIGNPPYNVGQVNENDNNKNRKYRVVDSRIRLTYAKDSQAALYSKLYDPYVKFLRWATDRLDDRDGMVCFVSNNSFVDQTAFDGMRKHLEDHFSAIYHLDLRGNVRHNPTLSGTAYNVFGIQVGVGITIAVRCKRRSNCALHYWALPLQWRREDKLAWLRDTCDITHLKFRRLKSDEQHNWLTDSSSASFRQFIPLGTKASKRSDAVQIRGVLFRTFSLGVSTNRDSVTYSINRDNLITRIEAFADAYNAELDRLQRKKKRVTDIDSFVDYTRVKWSSTLKGYLLRGKTAGVSRARIRTSLYRPFAKQHLYYDHLYVDRPGLFGKFLPTTASENENRIVVVPTVGNRGVWMPFTVGLIPNLNLTSIDAYQCFPFYIYDKDGTNRRENITDWALKHFREHYGDRRISKWDIFYYVYGLLHHPGYRKKFAGNLKRELPRVPLAPPLEAGDERSKPGSGFRAFAKAGKRLAKLHIAYESLEPWPLEWIETPGEPLSYVVEKMRLSKDKRSIKVNDSLTLAGIPPEIFDYRLGNRSAIEWVIDQYRVKEDKRSGIRSDPNNPEDPEYIVRLLGQVVRVSVETVKIVTALPVHYAPAPASPPSVG